MSKNSKKNKRKVQKVQNKNKILISFIVLIALFFAGAYVYKTKQSDKSLALSKEKAQLFQRPYSYTVGNKNAKVQLVEFFDPACETCALFHPYIKDMLKKYDGELKLVLRYAPFHKNSFYAVQMLEGAREQGKFMETLELLFATQKYWTIRHEVKPKIIWQILSKMKILDMEKLAAYINSKKAEAIIKQDLEDAKTLNVTKTPGYIVNGKPLQEFSLDNLKELIKSEIKR